MATKEREYVQHIKGLEHVEIPPLKYDRSKDESEPCYKEKAAASHCMTYRTKGDCHFVLNNVKQCKKFWKFVINDRSRKGIEPELPPVAERQKVLEEYAYFNIPRPVI